MKPMGSNILNVRRLLQKHGIGLLLLNLLIISIALASCGQHAGKGESADWQGLATDSTTPCQQRHYAVNSNFELFDDSILLERLPIKDSYALLHKGDQVVVAEFDVFPADSIDSIWVKLAHSEEIQGWVREKELIESFVPTDSISEAIYIFSHTHVSYFIIIFALFVVMLIVRAFRRKQLKLVYFNDIDSIYPVLLCLIVSFSATLYESMQLFAPDMWQYFYFNPTLSPFKTPFILGIFLASFWVSLAVFIAVIDDSFKQLRPIAAIFYLLGVMSACIFCYFFFIFTTHYYIGYLFMAAFIALFIRRVIRSVGYKYCCGKCGKRIKSKGICPHCGTENI